MWQPLGQVTTDSREAALEAGLALPECPAASERPALSAVPLRYWQPFICSPPPPPEGHEWQPFVPAVEDQSWSEVGGGGFANVAAED